MVLVDPDGVDGTCEKRGKGEDDADRICRFLGRSGLRSSVKIADDRNAGADGYKSERRVHGNRRFHDDVVQHRHGWCDQHPHDLVELYARVGEGEVEEDDVADHGDGQREDPEHGNALWLKDIDARS